MNVKEGSKVKIFLRSGYLYSGEIINLDSIFLTLKNRDGQIMSFPLASIDKLEENK